MGMLQKKPAEKPAAKKPLLTHTPGGVEVLNQVDRETIMKTVRESSTKPAPKKPAEKTTSIRISVSTRNALNSLVTLGEAETVNQLLAQLVAQKLESLSESQRNTFNVINEVAENK